MSLPNFTDDGDLPVGVYRVSLEKVIEHFGKGSAKRQQIAQRLERIHKIAFSAGKIAHFIIFGSFVTAKL